eukprot:INCI4507.1.p1 GENE.INCI4507.1~~INCI4507.1.p1  ORF type:complete len:599 (-),score=103.94 INCI4507.1:287-2083(-)
MGRKLSGDAVFALVAAVLFVARDAFVAGKICSLLPVGAVDNSTNPFDGVSDTIMAFFYGAFLVVYAPLFKMSPLFYVGGIGTYALGYVLFAASAATVWIVGMIRKSIGPKERNLDFFSTDGFVSTLIPGATTTDPDAQESSIVVWLEAGRVLAVAGSVSFFIGSCCYLYNSRELCPCRTNTLDRKFCCSFLSNAFSKQPVWFGSCSFLLGSALYVAASLIDLLNIATSSAPFYQVAIVLFVLGRFFFASDAVVAITHGRHFVYGGSTSESINVALAITMAFRLFRAFLRIKADEKNTLPSMPSGPWVHRARRNSTTQEPGVIKVDERGRASFTATICQSDGTFQSTSIRLQHGDSFRVDENGELQRAYRSGAGLTTPRMINFVMRWFDELDVRNLGVLTPSTLHEVVCAIGLGELINEKSIKYAVEEFDLDSGRHTGSEPGIDLLEMIMLVTSCTGLRPSNTVLEAIWSAVRANDEDEDGSPGDCERVDPQKLFRMLHFDMRAKSVEYELIERLVTLHSTDGIAMTKEDFFFMLLTRPAAQLECVSSPVARQAPARNRDLSRRKSDFQDKGHPDKTSRPRKSQGKTMTTDTEMRNPLL